ncbi:hypothetical protein D3C85_1660120 [compost metagenome]
MMVRFTAAMLMVFDKTLCLPSLLNVPTKNQRQNQFAAFRLGNVPKNKLNQQAKFSMLTGHPTESGLILKLKNLR